MFYKRLLLAAVIGTMTGWARHTAHAGDLKISLPQRSKPTPVQRLNREGVEAIRKHQYEKAKALFYKAYLFDPDDPFTLNNLGYVSELEGKMESAARFYLLASQRATDAVVDQASVAQVRGKSIKDALTSSSDSSMQANRNNLEAVRLLSKERAPEAERLLKQALSLDPQNAFTLNNLGVAKEMEGELEEAAKYYAAAANLHSSEPVVIAWNGAWHGKPVSEMAAANGRKMLERQTEESTQPEVARLSLRGVAAINKNHLEEARQYFQRAYALDPNYSFSLNNIGYLAEMDGDPETAYDFYVKAQEANRADARVGLATSRSAEGMKLTAVAEESGQHVDARMEERHAERQRQKVTVQLRRRDKKPGAGSEQLRQPPNQTIPQEQKPIP